MMWKSRKFLALFLVLVLVLQSVMAWPSREQATEPLPVLEEPVEKPLEQPEVEVVEAQEPSPEELLLSLENEQLKKDIEELQNSLKELEGKRVNEELAIKLRNEIDTVFLGAQMMSAGNKELSEKYQQLESEYNALAEEHASYINAVTSEKKKTDLSLEVVPKATYTFGENVWGAGIDVGFAVNDIVIEAGIEKKIQNWNSFTSPDGYTMSLGVGYRF